MSCPIKKKRKIQLYNCIVIQFVQKMHVIYWECQLVLVDKNCGFIVKKLYNVFYSTYCPSLATTFFHLSVYEFRVLDDDFDVEDKKHTGRPKLVEDAELEALFDEDPCQTQEESLRVNLLNHFHAFKSIKNDSKARKLGTV